MAAGVEGFQKVEPAGGALLSFRRGDEWSIAALAQVEREGRRRAIEKAFLHQRPVDGSRWKVHRDVRGQIVALLGLRQRLVSDDGADGWHLRAARRRVLVADLLIVLAK